MDTQPLTVLLIEDNNGDARLIKEMLKESSAFSFETLQIDSLHQLRELSERHFDVVLLDLHFEDTTGVETYGYASIYFPMTPIIVLTGLSDERLAYQVVKLGAQDYLLKDVIDSKGLIRSIRYAIERKKADVQKDEFLGFASHELKTPVTSIKAYIQLMELYASNSDAKKNKKSLLPFIQKVDFQIDKLTHLISDLLDVTKVQSGKLQFNFEHFLINDIVDEVIDTMQLTTDKHRIVKKGKSNAYVYGDKERTSQVLINLISNAIKYSPKADKVIVQIKNGSEKVGVTVKDFGIGIASNNQEKLFDRFFRVNDKTGNKETYPGLGLGLYIASEITKRQNGKLFVHSTEGEGSEFCFELPAVDPVCLKEP